MERVQSGLMLAVDAQVAVMRRGDARLTWLSVAVGAGNTARPMFVVRRPVMGVVWWFRAEVEHSQISCKSDSAVHSHYDHPSIRMRRFGIRSTR